MEKTDRKEPPMTWAEHHRREEILRSVAELADRRRDGLLPWDEISDVADIFPSPADLLAALQMRWYTRLSGNVEAALADQPSDLERSVVHAWRWTAAGLPGTRAVLDANLAHPALATARRTELALLAGASGRSRLDGGNVVGVGQEIEDWARGITVETTVRGAA